MTVSDDEESFEDACLIASLRLSISLLRVGEGLEEVL